jgi:hypothetical protein
MLGNYGVDAQLMASRVVLSSYIYIYIILIINTAAKQTTNKPIDKQKQIQGGHDGMVVQNVTHTDRCCGKRPRSLQNIKMDLNGMYSGDVK